MGYMNLSVIGSDAAADFALNLGNQIAEAMRKEFADLSATEYNTEGPINVAMIFEEVICLCEVFNYNDKLVAMAVRSVKYLDRLLIESRKVKSENWKGRGMHLLRYKQMRDRIQRWLDENSH